MNKVVFKNSNGNYYVTETVKVGEIEQNQFINCAKKQKAYFDLLFNSEYAEKSINGKPYLKVDGYYFNIPDSDGKTFRVFCISKNVIDAIEAGKIIKNYKDGKLFF